MQLLALATGRHRTQPGVDHHRRAVAVRPLGADLGIADFGGGADPGQFDVFKVFDPVAVAGVRVLAVVDRQRVIADQRRGRVFIVVHHMEQRHFQLGQRPETDLRAPLAAVARVVGAVVRHLGAPGAVQKLTARPDHVGGRQVAAHRWQFGAFPLVLHIAAEGQHGVDPVRGRHLPDRQQHFLDLHPRLRGLDRVGRVLHAIHAGVIQALAPGFDMPPGLDVEHGVVLKPPAAKHVGVQQPRAPAAVSAGVAGERVIAAVFVDGTRGVVVVVAVVHIVIESTGPHHGTVVVFAQDHLAQRADPVGGQAVLVEVAVRVIRVDAHQAIAGGAQAHADAITGGHRPIQGRAIVKLDGLTGPQRAGEQRDGGGQACDLNRVRAQPRTFIVVFINHTASPDSRHAAASMGSSVIAWVGAYGPAQCSASGLNVESPVRARR